MSKEEMDRKLMQECALSLASTDKGSVLEHIEEWCNNFVACSSDPDERTSYLMGRSLILGIFMNLFKEMLGDTYGELLKNSPGDASHILDKHIELLF
jgi:hypothetical protein